MSDSIVHAGFLLHSQSSDPHKARARAAEVKPWVKCLPAPIVYGMMPYLSGKPDIGYAQVTSIHGQTVRLHFGGVGMSGEQLKRHEKRAVRTCADCINDMVYQHRDIAIAGLGAHTASIGRGGQDIRDLVSVPVTTGNSLTVYFGIKSVLEAARAMHIDTKDSTLCVVGVSGNIGGAIGTMIRPEFKRIVITQHRADIRSIATRLGAEVIDNLNDALRLSDVVITSTTSSLLGYDINAFKPGAVIVVLSRPRDVAAEIMQRRDDVLAIEGGNVSVPNPSEYIITRDIEQPDGTIYPCMTETTVLALDGNVRDVSMGPLETRRILKIGQRAEYHGFQLAPGFRFEREITADEINNRYEAGQIALQQHRYRGLI